MIVIHFGNIEEYIDEITLFEKNLNPRITRAMFQLAPIHGKKTIYMLWLLSSTVIALGQERHIARLEVCLGECDPTNKSDPSQAAGDNKYAMLRKFCTDNNIAFRPGYYAWATERS